MNEHVESGGPPLLRRGAAQRILAEKRSREQHHLFKNKELEGRFRAATTLDMARTGMSVMLVLLTVAMGSGVWALFPTLQEAKLFLQKEPVLALMFVVVWGYLAYRSIAGIVNNVRALGLRRQLYERYSNLVLELEPQRKYIWAYEAKTDKEASRLVIGDDEAQSGGKEWLLPYSNLLNHHPRAFRGMWADVYLEPPSGKPFALFINDSVCWLI